MYLLQDKAGGSHVTESPLFQWQQQEADLVDWWLQAAENRVDLRTEDGGHLIVLDAGKRNDGPGPDILECHLMLDDREISGEVEVHQNGYDWFQHGHNLDPSYRNVILHVLVNPKGGPDIRTLVVQKSQINRHVCLARRAATSSELLELAFDRFKRKVRHFQFLAKTGENPYLLGLLEIVCAGKYRFQLLQELAQQFGLAQWPDTQAWSGSHQSYPSATQKQKLIKKLISQRRQFPFTCPPLEFECWSEMDQTLKDIHNLGISLSQGREWVVNIIAPGQTLSGGFEVWVKTTVFRHYGIEKTLCKKLKYNKVRSIAEQQGLLEWQKQYCGPQACSVCPLVRPHQLLTYFD